MLVDPLPPAIVMSFSSDRILSHLTHPTRLIQQVIMGFWLMIMILVIGLGLHLFSPQPIWGAIQIESDITPQTSTSQNPDLSQIKGNLTNDVLYYIIVDRFSDGDPDNNIPSYAFPLDPNLPKQEQSYNELNQLLLRHSYDPTHRYVGLYWGGDLQGVINRLDYLQDLGVTKLVLSPIQDNANGIVYYPAATEYLHFEKEDGDDADLIYSHASAAFHGYWTKDWFEIDEHFRDPRDQSHDRYQILRELLNQAGERGIGIILDLTLNHTSPFPYYRYPPEFVESSIGFWFVDNGSVFRHGQRVATYWDPSTGELDPSKWFHPFLPIDFNRPTPEMIEKGTLPGGLPDLNQDKPEVEAYLLDAVRFWLTFNAERYPIAGFRLDAVKHVNLSFWQKLEDLVLSINSNAVLLGEYFSGGYRNMDSINWIAQTQGYTQFNFNLSMSARSFFARQREWDGRSFMLQEATLGRDGHYYNLPPLQQFIHWLLDPGQTLDIPRKALDLIPDADMQGWVNFVENHDIPRLLTVFPDMTQQAYTSLIKYTFVTPGVPMLMYGVETGLAIPYHPDHAGLFGIGGDPFNRQMMIWPGDPGWQNDLFKSTQLMAHLRQDYPVLRYGSTRYLSPKGSDPKDDIFMLREPQTCDRTISSCHRILYAYSTFGGEYLVSLEEVDPEIEIYENVETQRRSRLMDGLLPVRLDPEQAKVFILE